MGHPWAFDHPTRREKRKRQPGTLPGKFFVGIFDSSFTGHRRRFLVVFGAYFFLAPLRWEIGFRWEKVSSPLG